MDPFIGAILKNIIIPEVIMIVRTHMQASGGRFPTEAEVIAMLPQEANRYQVIGQAFLDATRPITPAVPVSA